MSNAGPAMSTPIPRKIQKYPKNHDKAGLKGSVAAR